MQVRTLRSLKLRVCSFPHRSNWRRKNATSSVAHGQGALFVGSDTGPSMRSRRIRGALVGRLDAKAHRSDGIFQVKALYLESGVRVTQRLIADVSAALLRCAAWHGTKRVAIDYCDPASLKRQLKAALK